MAEASGFQKLHGSQAGYGSTGGAPRASLEARRAAVLSYQQIVGSRGSLPAVVRSVASMPRQSQRAEAVQRISAEALARDPLAHPMAPPRPSGAAKLVYEVVTEPIEAESWEPAKADALFLEQKWSDAAVERAIPLAEPRYRGSVHGGTFSGIRSRLSPSQRAALRKTESRRDFEREPAYITYTVNMRAAK
jgi:hypothetical protein